MQLTSPTAATPKPAPIGGFSAQTLLPREMQTARIGKGTVESEVDRSIRVRLEGDGAPSTRTIVADSRAAADLLASKDGPKFDKALRSFLAVADPHVGHENLKTITLLPDEHASKGVSVLNWADSATRQGIDIDQMINPTEYRVGKIRTEHPEFSRAEIRAGLRRFAASEGVKQLTANEAANVSFAGAWNGNGHIVVMPDVSRDMLATLGMYRIQPGDSTAQVPPASRDRAARYSWHAALHEAHHSITPLEARHAPEHTRVMEESVPEVLTPASVLPTVRAAGADFSLAARPARDTKHEAVDWPAWNRDHLPKPPADQAATAEGRYTDGPELVRQLLRMAGIDRRTTEGKATALALLQGQTASRVPKRLADAIVAARGLEPAQADKLADLIRGATVGDHTIGEITRFVGA